jgi:hypothetical protein
MVVGLGCAFHFARSIAQRPGPRGAIENRQLASWRTIAESFKQEHVVEQQKNSRSAVGQVALSCYSAATMHLLATLPIGEDVLIECARGCVDNVVSSPSFESKLNTHLPGLQHPINRQNLKEMQTLGASVWGNGVYADHSLVCLATKHHTGKDGGMFVLTIGAGQSQYFGSNQNGITSLPLMHAQHVLGRSITISKAGYPFRLDVNNDGAISEAEAAAAGDVIFKGIPGLAAGAGDTAVNRLSAELAKEIDADGDLVLTSNEVLAWTALRLGAAQHPELR